MTLSTHLNLGFFCLIILPLLIITHVIMGYYDRNIERMIVEEGPRLHC